MIHYNVRCSHAHEFDGWFKDSAAFDRQAKRGLVECPTCGDTKVERALMAPAVATRDTLPGPGRRPLPAVPPMAQSRGQSPGQSSGQSPASSGLPAPESPMAVSGGPLPDQARAMLQRMRSEVEKHCDYVGPAFADEARKMHNGESAARNIYGETTPEQAEALSDEGIEFSRIPWVPRADG